MKYLKLFENFQNEDPKWIVTSALDPIEVDEITFDKEYKDTSMFRLFELSEFPTQEKLDHLESWLEEEGYYYNQSVNKDKGSLQNRILVTNKPIKEAFVEWLNTNYSGMKAVKSKDYHGQAVLYRYKPKDNIFVYDKESKVWMTYEIWDFSIDYFGLSERETKYIIEKWLSDTYNLKDITIRVPLSFVHSTCL